MRKTVIQPRSAIDVRFSANEIEDIRERTFADPDFGAAAVQVGTDYVLQMTLDDIEVVQGYVAAEANHAGDRRIQKRLHQIADKLQEYLDTYEEADQIESASTRHSGSVIAFPSSSGPHHAAEASTPRSILHQLLDDAEKLGSDLLEIRYKDGYEEVFATVRGFSYRIATIRSSHPDAAKLRDELAILATCRKRSARNASELRASFEIRVSTYDDFGETAYRVTFKHL